MLPLSHYIVNFIVAGGLIVFVVEGYWVARSSRLSRFVSARRQARRGGQR